MMTVVRFVAVAALGFFGGLMPAWAQGGPGTIRGQVTDPAGGSIPGAVVSVNNGHGTSRSATTDVRGEYALGNLPADAVVAIVLTGVMSHGSAGRGALVMGMSPAAQQQVRAKARVPWLASEHDRFQRAARVQVW